MAEALTGNVTGNYNTAVGYDAMKATMTEAPRWPLVIKPSRMTTPQTMASPLRETAEHGRRLSSASGQHQRHRQYGRRLSHPFQKHGRRKQHGHW